MPATISKLDDRQIIGGVFSNRKNADEAIQALSDLGIPDHDIQVVVTLNHGQTGQALADALVGRGVAESQALFYDRAVRSGKVLVAVHNITDPAPVIEIFDDFKAEYNPDGSRNLREDVAGMTTGVAVGAAVGGVAGTIVAGAAGAAVGAATGAIVGGGAGAAAGKAAEHRK